MAEPVFSKDFGPCVDWAWAEPGVTKLGCQRDRSCGAANVGFCPLAKKRSQGLGKERAHD